MRYKYSDHLSWVHREMAEELASVSGVFDGCLFASDWNMPLAGQFGLLFCPRLFNLHWYL